MKKKSDFKSLGGKARQYLDTKTGEIISRRQYIKLTKGVSPEELAENNLVRDPTTALSRPARGRKSVLKESPVIQETVAQARLEEKIKREAEEKAEKERRDFERRLQRSLNKKVKRLKVRKQLLRPGHQGARINFNNYAEYIEALNEARQTGVVRGYGLGIAGIDENTGQERHVTVYHIMTLSTVIPLWEFEEEMETALVDRPYLIAHHFFMHLAFSKEYAKEKAARYKHD